MTKLSGMKEITKYVGLCEKTVNALIEHNGFPARKKGMWVSDTELIDAWWKEFVTGKTKPETEDPKPPRKQLTQSKR